MLEYVSKKSEYTFDQLATEVLNFSQDEVRKYEEQKQEEKAKQATLCKLSKELATLMVLTNAEHSKFTRIETPTVLSGIPRIIHTRTKIAPFSREAIYIFRS